MPIARAVLLAAVCAAVSACAAKPPPPPPPVPVKPADPPPPLDGTYWGTSTRFRAESRRCPHPGLVKLELLNGQFQYRWDYRTFVDASVDADGSVHGEAPGITLVGKRDGRLIDGDVTNGSCGLHFTVRRKG